MRRDVKNLFVFLKNFYGKSGTRTALPGFFSSELPEFWGYAAKIEPAAMSIVDLARRIGLSPTNQAKGFEPFPDSN